MEPTIPMKGITNFKLLDCAYVPDFYLNIISAPKGRKNGLFYDSRASRLETLDGRPVCHVNDQEGIFLIKWALPNQLYDLKSPDSSIESYISRTSIDPSDFEPIEAPDMPRADPPRPDPSRADFPRNDDSPRPDSPRNPDLPRVSDCPKAPELYGKNYPSGGPNDLYKNDSRDPQVSRPPEGPKAPQADESEVGKNDHLGYDFKSPYLDDQASTTFIEYLDRNLDIGLKCLSPNLWKETMDSMVDRLPRIDIGSRSSSPNLIKMTMAVYSKIPKISQAPPFLWHQRLGYLDEEALSHLTESSLNTRILNPKKNEFQLCPVC